MDSINNGLIVSDLQIPKRRNAGGGGTKGRATEIHVNHLPLDLDELFKKTVYLMEVSIVPGLPKHLLRPALNKFCYKHYPNVQFAFEGWKNIYTTQYLMRKQDIIHILNEETHQIVDFHIDVSVANAIKMNKIQEYIAKGSSNFPPNDAIWALEIILRNISKILKITKIQHLYFPLQCIKPVDLSGGLELWKGFHQSLQIGWKPYLVIKAKNKAFIKSQSLITYIQKDLCCDVNSEMDQKNLIALSNFVTNLKVYYFIPNQLNSKRSFYVNGLLENALKFYFEKKTDKKMINVIDYYKHYKNYTIKYPNLPCLHVGNDSSALPIELCTIQKEQRQSRKLNAYQNACITKNSIQPPLERRQYIEKFIREASYNEGPILNQFGIIIDDKLATIPARVLDQPNLAFAQNKILTPLDGVWKPEKLWKAVQIKRWIVLNLDYHTKISDIKNFENSLITCGKLINVDVNPMYRPFNCFLQNSWNLDKIQRIVTQFFNAKKNTVEIIVVVIPDNNSTELYGAVKQWSELIVGVLTQCIKSKTIQMMKMNKQFQMSSSHNLLLKINSKLNGVNHILAEESSLSIMKGSIIIGASTNHPPSEAINPTIATVAASHDHIGNQYNMEWSFQAPNTSIIHDLDNMVHKQLIKFKSMTGHVPAKIFYFRDAVCQSDFAQLLDHELIAIRKACLRINMAYKPPVTFLIIQKKHFTRMFPKNHDDMEGRAFNVPIGTVVDTQITHPTEFDFYLCSHNHTQGTTIPTRYHLMWDDSNFTEDQLEQLTFHMCYMHACCTSSVSYPIPILYSHSAGLRVRKYIKNKKINLNRLSEEQDKYKRISSLNDKTPMHFI